MNKINTQSIIIAAKRAREKGNLTTTTTLFFLSLVVVVKEAAAAASVTQHTHTHSTLVDLLLLIDTQVYYLNRPLHTTQYPQHIPAT
jgi:hypothetical protein